MPEASCRWSIASEARNTLFEDDINHPPSWYSFFLPLLCCLVIYEHIAIARPADGTYFFLFFFDSDMHSSLFSCCIMCALHHPVISLCHVFASHRSTSLVHPSDWSAAYRYNYCGAKHSIIVVCFSFHSFFIDVYASKSALLRRDVLDNGKSQSFDSNAKW